MPRKKSLDKLFNKIKSPETLFNKTNPPDVPNFVLNQNILYLTHQIDKCLVVLKKLEVDTGIQTQVDEYFNDKDSAQEEEEVVK